MRELKRLLLDDEAQTTAEYALVILAAAALAGALITWATKGGAITKFFSKIFSKLTESF